jgi:hypothetical protein
MVCVDNSIEKEYNLFKFIVQIYCLLEFKYMLIDIPIRTEINVSVRLSN